MAGSQNSTRTAPKVFVSYAHEGPEHQDWVKSLARDLRSGGIDVWLDKWRVPFGADFTLFMDQIRRCDRVLLICTPTYARKANEGKGGVGYERSIITAELVKSISTSKFVCVLRAGTSDEAIPTFARTRRYIDFRNDSQYDYRLLELLRDLHDAPADPEPPPGPNPFKDDNHSSTVSLRSSHIPAPDLLGRSSPPKDSGRVPGLLKDIAANLAAIFRHQAQEMTSPEGNAVYVRHRSHVLLSTGLLCGLVFMEGWMAYRVFAPLHSPVSAWSRILAATGIICAGLLLSFALPTACIRHRRTWSWYASAGILLICFAIGTLLVLPLLPPVNSINPVYRLAPGAGFMQNMFIIWMFGFILVTNTFNAVVSLEHLIERKQFLTLEKCLRWESPLEGRLPVRCLVFPWVWGALVVSIVAVVLIAWEGHYFLTLEAQAPAAYWQATLGMARQLLFLVAIIEVMLFYKLALAAIRAQLT